MIIVSLSRRELEKHGACKNRGIPLFEAICGLVGSNVECISWECTPLHQVWLAVTYPWAHSWLLSKGLIPTLHLEGAYLEGAYLEGANLEGAYLYGAAV